MRMGFGTMRPRPSTQHNIPVPAVCEGSSAQTDRLTMWRSCCQTCSGAAGSRSTCCCFVCAAELRPNTHGHRPNVGLVEHDIEGLDGTAVHLPAGRSGHERVHLGIGAELAGLLGGQGGELLGRSLLGVLRLGSWLRCSLRSLGFGSRLGLGGSLGLGGRCGSRLGLRSGGGRGSSSGLTTAALGRGCRKSANHLSPSKRTSRRLWLGSGGGNCEAQ